MATKAIIAAKTLVCELRNVEVTHNMIIELIPTLVILLLVLSDEGIVVTRVCSTGMYNHALELELIVVTRVLERLGLAIVRGVFSPFSSLLLLLCRLLPSCQALLGIWHHVELEREFTVVVDLDPHHAIEVKLEPLERDDQVAW